MKIRTLFYCGFALISIGCAKPEDSDTAPLPAKDTAARVDDASQGVKSSNMTPEQKQSALDYLNRGASGAEKMKSMAQGATAGAK
jgi:hypothetical protein